MVLILLSWLYIFMTSVTLGISFAKLFKIQSLNGVTASVLGLFCVTLMASLWAIFGPIDIVFHVFTLTATVFLGYYFWTDLKMLLKSIPVQITSFSLAVKILLGSSCLLILAQSATLPFIIDNETYYIQTIKWLNEYGFVPGLANLHLFFGQTSGWHIAQSAYSFSFLYENFNDLNGYLLLVVNFWAFQKLESYFKTNNRLDLVFGLLPLTYALLFQFVSSPSPDLAVYLLGFILFSIFLESPDAAISRQFNLLTILALFAVYIKITAVVLLVFPLSLFIKNYAEIKNQLVSIRLLSGLVLFLFTIKNIILTGYPFYPLTVFPYSGADYVVPKEIMTYFFGSEMRHSFYMGFGSLESASYFNVIKQYFLHSGMDSIIGVMTLSLLAISPFVIAKYYSKSGLKAIYLVFVTLLVLLIFSSPQYRFYLYFTIFFGLVVFSILLSKKKLVYGLLGFSLIVSGILVFVPLTFSALTQNKLLTENVIFQGESFLHPKPNTKQSHKYQKIVKGNLEYLSPGKTSIFWISGNGNLPCVNQEQLNYFETNFHIIPQLRGKTLGEGFYAKKTNSND